MDPEQIVDRRRLRRRASFWRLAAFVIAAIAIVVIAMSAGDIGGKVRRTQVAEISVSGFIDTNPQAVATIAAAAEADAVKAIVLRVNSPGGVASGGEALFRAVRDAAAEKPVVAVIEGLGASGAYMTAIAADHLVARESALTGSIGVIMQYPNIEALLGKIGVEYNAIKSAPLKAEPDFFSEPDPAAVAAMQAIVDDTFEWFVELVAERRDLSQAEALRLSDGRIYTGRQALEAGLIDALGGMSEARDWLAAQRDVPVELPGVKWDGGLTQIGLPTARFVGRLARLFGVDWRWQPAVDRLVPEHLLVDGLLLVWHAPAGSGSGT